MKTLIVIDMQNDFVTGVLGSKEAVAVLPNVKKKIDAYIAVVAGHFRCRICVIQFRCSAKKHFSLGETRACK